MHGLKEPLAQVDHARLADSTLGASFLLTHDRGRSKPSLRPRATPDEKETPPKAHCGAETHARPDFEQQQALGEPAAPNDCEV